MPRKAEPLRPPGGRQLTMPLRHGPWPVPLLPGPWEPEASRTGNDAEDDLRAINVELRALLGFAEGTFLSPGTTAAMELLLETVVSTYGFARGAVLQGEHQLAIIARHGLDGDLISPGASASVRRALSSSVQQVVTDATDVEPWLSQFAPSGAELLVQPLVRQPRRFGALVLQVPSSLQGSHRSAVFARIAHLADFTSEALNRDQRLGQLQRLAATDDLTMIANRRSFDASLEREMARSLRSGEPLSLALFDLDLFKRVNDEYGHPAGDDLLRNVAAALVGACRDLDTPARYGGEEFAVILPDCAAEDSLLLVERLRLAVAAAPGITSITASAGVATFPRDASTVEKLITAADEALLAAKRAGRNQTRLAPREVTAGREDPAKP